MPSVVVIVLSVFVALLGTGLIASTVVLVVKSAPCAPCTPCTPCAPCDCYAKSVSAWQMGP